MNSKLKNKLRKIFNKHDPIIYFGKDTNFDEYDPEIEGVILRFQRSNNLKKFTEEIYNLFQKMFSQEIAGPISKYKKLAEGVYDLLKSELKKKT